MVNLYALAKDYWELVEQADAPEPGTQEAIDKWFEGFSGKLEEAGYALDQKLEAITQVIRQLEADEKALREEKKRFADRERAVKGRRERLKSYASNTILTFVEPDPKGRRRVETSKFLMWVQKNPISVDEDKCNVLDLDDQFVEFVPQIKKSAILELVKTTGELPKGAALKEEKWTFRVK